MSLLRKLIASITEQIFYYIAIFISLFSWSYFASGYIAGVVFIIGIVSAWGIASFIEGKDLPTKSKLR